MKKAGFQGLIRNPMVMCETMTFFSSLFIELSQSSTASQPLIPTFEATESDAKVQPSPTQQKFELYIQNYRDPGICMSKGLCCEVWDEITRMMMMMMMMIGGKLRVGVGVWKGPGGRESGMWSSVAERVGGLAGYLFSKIHLDVSYSPLPTSSSNTWKKIIIRLYQVVKNTWIYNLLIERVFDYLKSCLCVDFYDFESWWSWVAKVPY